MKRRNTSNGHFKLFTFVTLSVVAVYMFSLKLEPKVTVVERIVNDQVQLIDGIHPSE